MSVLLKKDGCGPCIGSPIGEVCNADLAPRGDMPATPHSRELCRKALFLLGEDRPERIERNGLPHAWSLLERAINLSDHYRSTAEGSFREAMEITRHIAHERPYASAEERIQSQIITAFAPMYWEKYFGDDDDMHGELMQKSRSETMAELGRVIGTTWQRRYADFEVDELGTVSEQTSQAEIMYLILRAGLEVWPASHREEKNSQSRFNHDCYVMLGGQKLPIQIVSSEKGKKKKYDPSILVLDYKKFQNDVMSGAQSKQTGYDKFIRQQIFNESRGKEISGAKAKKLDRASSYLAGMVTDFAEQQAA